MNGHVLEHTDVIPTNVDTNSMSANGQGSIGTTTYNTSYTNIKLGLVKEPMAYGCDIMSSSGRDAGCGKSQIALFRLDPTWIVGRESINWWLGAVSSSTAFARCSGAGFAANDNATISLGVRPYFLFA